MDELNDLQICHAGGRFTEKFENWKIEPCTSRLARCSAIADASEKLFGYICNKSVD